MQLSKPAFTCPSCSFRLPEHSRFCPQCGSYQEPICPKCGRPTLAGSCATCGTISPAISPARPADPSASLRAERRQLTIMFCDLVGSTPLALSGDPEDLLDAMKAFQTAVATTVERHGGYVARCVGDGVLIYFGWPQAHENNEERAARAGLAVVEAVGAHSIRGEPLAVRIGIASGLVVVGDFGGPEAVAEQAVIGAAANLAARLQALANPDTVVICDATRARLGDLFALDNLGALPIKGYTEPVPVWRVTGETRVDSRFEALHGRRLTPIVGRSKEVELMLDNWRTVQDGRGCVVLVAGEAGIGKSRLIAALEERVRSRPCSQLRYFCAPHQEDGALHPVVSHLERRVDPDRTADPDEKLRALAALFRRARVSEENIALVAEMLSLPVDPATTANISPQRRKERTLAALTDQIEQLSVDGPVLMVLEDAHWADPTTLELFARIVEEIESLPVLLVVTFRPGFDLPWRFNSHPGLIRLDRLARDEAADLIGEIDGPRRLSPAIIDHIISASDGVPLFIEELTRAALDDVVLGSPGKSFASAGSSVPHTLEALLMARLDRFPVAKEVAQAGAVIGREFPHQLIAAVAQIPEPTLREGLRQLVSSEVLFCHGEPPAAEYTFKHVLVQDAAYETILRSRRSALHARIVEVLLEQDPDVEQARPGMLGYHCARGGQIERAAVYYRRAGEQAAERAALAETRGHLERGMTLLGSLPDGAERRVLEIEMKLALGRVLLSTKGSADIEAGGVFEEALKLSRSVERNELFTRAMWGFWFNKAHRRELTVAEAAAHEMLAVGKRRTYRPASVAGGCMLGITRFWQGRFEDARSHLQSALDLSRSGRDKPLDLAIVADNLPLHITMQLSLSLACRGSLAEAAGHAANAMQQAGVLAHLPSRAIVLAAKCRHDWFVRDDQALRQTVSVLAALSNEQGFPFYASLAQCHLGWLAVKERHVEAGLNLLKTGLKAIQSTDANIWEPYLRGMMGEALVWAGQATEAVRVLDEALALSAQTGGVWFDAELHRCKGEALLARKAPRVDRARICFRRAIAIAQEQQATLWEERAAARLAELQAGQS